MSPILPVLSIVMPVYNEEKFISQTLQQLFEQDYPPDRFEILVVDGMSTDRTQSIVSAISQQHDNIHLLKNFQQRSSAGRNIGFKAAKGDYCVVVDGHCFIPDSMFLRNIATAFEKSGADCLGRPQPLDPPGLTTFQKAVALARKSRVGHGGDSLIYGSYEGFASPVSNGAAYHRQVFATVGYVDENFDACEDVEFNYRVKKAGFTCYTAPNLEIKYYPRETLASLFRQMMRYGEGRRRFTRKHPEALTFNQLIPAAFVIGIISLFLLSLLLPFVQISTLLVAMFTVPYIAYTIMLAGISAKAMYLYGIRLGSLIPAILLAIHLGLGLGFLKEAASRRRKRTSTKIKIAFVIDTIESPTAGTEKQLLMLIKNLDRDRFQPFLCVLNSSDWILKEFAACEVFLVGVPSFGTFASYYNILKFISFLRREQIDILQTHFVEGNLIGVIAGKMAGVKAIISTRRNQGYWHDRLHLMLLKMLNRWTTCFLANSVSTRDWVERVEGIDSRRIRAIYNGLDIDGYYHGTKTQRRQFREHLGFPANAIILGIVANLRPVKSIDMFIRAAKKVLERSPHVRILIVGEGAEMSALVTICNELNVASSVRFLGKRLDIPEILSCMDIGVLSSSSESFSNSIVEYMAAGLAVVCTDVGGAREAIEDGISGYVVPCGDASRMTECLSRIVEQDMFQEMGRRGRERAVAMFSHKNIVSQYQCFYEEMA